MKKKNLNEQYRNWFSRTAGIRTDKANDDEMVVESGVLATEQPVVVWDWFRWEPVREILLMKGCNIPENGQVPLLDSHSRFSTSTIKGSVRNIIDEKDDNGNPTKVADYHFEREAKREFNLVKDKHLTDTSIGYKTYDEHTVVLAPGEKTTIEGHEYRNDYGDDMPLLIRLTWDLKEDSLVAIGADDRAKFRSELTAPEELPVSNLDNVNPEDIEGIKTSLKEINNNIKIISIKGDDLMTEEEKRQLEKDAVKADRLRISQIKAYAEKFKGQFPNENEIVREAIEQDWHIDKFRTHVIDNLEGGVAVSTPASENGMTGKEVQDFSLIRAMNAVANKNLDGAGFEKEVLEDVHSRVQPKHGGFILPRAKQLQGARVINSFGDNFRLGMALNNPEMMERALAVATDSAGGYLVGTEHKGDAFIEMLRNKSVLGNVGITILGGQKENIDIPKQVGSATFNMVGEGSAADQSFLTLGHVTSSPKTGTATTEYTRRLLMQSNPAIDGLVLADLLGISRSGIDHKGLHGTGTGNDPEGVANVTGVGDVDMSTVTWGSVVEHETNIENANADDLGSMSWITNPSVKGKMKTTLKTANVAGYLMGENGQMNGYPSSITKNANAQHLFFGLWNQLVLIEYGNVEILVNPYGTNSRAGNVEVTIFVDFDFICRHAGAFSISSNVNIAQ